MKNNFIIPHWPVTAKAYTTTRLGGVSLAPYNQFNLGDHVGDDPHHVHQNRKLLREKLELPGEPFWIKQTHSTIAVDAKAENLSPLSIPEADASFTHQSNIPCVVLTADCLPLLIYSSEPRMVAAIHAGWRGLADGIIESTLNKMNIDPKNIFVWLGPAIGPEKFEVGNDVREIFIQQNERSMDAFKPLSNGQWLADIYHLARIRLARFNITQIYGGEFCTFSDEEQFYSYRRDGNRTGRMASLIWLAE